MTPPTTAPPTVPTALPPVRTAPPTAPAPAPMAVFLSCCDIPAQPASPSNVAAAAALTTHVCIDFIWRFLVRSVDCGCLARGTRLAGRTDLNAPNRCGRYGGEHRALAP